MSVIKNEGLNPLLGKTKGESLDGTCYYKTNELYPDGIKNQSFEFYLSSKKVNFSLFGNTSYTKGIRVQYKNTANRYYVNNNFEMPVTVSITNNTGIEHCVVVFDVNKCMYLYRNSVLIGTYPNGELYLSNTLTFMSIAGKEPAEGNIYHFRRFNYALSEQEVKNLYNNGRPDKFILGNEYKEINTNNKSITNRIELMRDYSHKEIVEEDGVQLYKLYGCTNFGKIWNDNYNIIKNKYYKITFKAKSPNCNSIIFNESFFRGNNPTTITNTLESYSIISYANTNNSRISCMIWNAYTWKESDKILYISDIEVEEVGCIGEYLPSSITLQKWLDTSGQNNHLIPEGTPEIIYKEPYQDIIVGENSPSSAPDFIGQKYIDTKNKKKYKSFGTSAISDWIALN